jgi:hypothetical protein
MTSWSAIHCGYRRVILWEAVGNRLSRSNYEATLVLVELHYDRVSDSSALVPALAQQRINVNATPAV